MEEVGLHVADLTYVRVRTRVQRFDWTLIGDVITCQGFSPGASTQQCGSRGSVRHQPSMKKRYVQPIMYEPISELPGFVIVDKLIYDEMFHSTVI